MPSFPNTPIGNSDPLDLCEGLELLPKAIPARVGIQSSQSSHTLFDIGLTAVFARLKVSAYYDFTMGICGPALAFLFDDVDVTTTNTADGGQVELDFSHSTQAMQAGMFVGFEFGGGVHVLEQEYLPKSWYSPWKFKWQTAFDAKISFSIDFIELFAELIEYLLEEAAADGLLEQDTADTLKDQANGRSSWKFFGESAGGLFDTPDRTLTATPSFPIPIDLVQYFPALTAFSKELHKIKGDLKFGPQFQLEVPVTMGVDHLTLDGVQGGGTADYADLAYSTAPDHLVASGPTPFSATASQRLTTHVSYGVDFTLGLGVYFKLSAAKLFSVSASSPSLDLLSLLSLGDVPLAEISNSVGVNLETGCVLTPAMTINLWQPGTVPSGTPVQGSILFPHGFPGSSLSTLTLSSDPPLPGFPVGVAVEPAAGSSAAFTVSFPNQGVPDGSGKTVSASPTSPSYTVNLTASAPAGIEDECGTPLVVTTPIKVENAIITVSRTGGPQAPGPLWNQDHGGAAINVNPALVPPDPDLAPPSGATPTIALNLKFPGPIQGSATPVKVTLLNDKRNKYTGSFVEVRVGARPWSPIGSGVTLLLSPDPNSHIVNLQVNWSPPGGQRNYSTRFILVFDAGVEYGQTEFWLDVWNWG